MTHACLLLSACALSFADAPGWRPRPERIDAVEFRFRGHFPADDFNATMFEYVIARAGDKDYECLLCVGREEMARLGQLRRMLETLERGGRRPQLEIVFYWSENGQARAVGLEQLLRLEPPATRRDFLARLGFTESGLGAFNLRADLQLLPKRRVPAEVTIRLRPSP